MTRTRRNIAPPKYLSDYDVDLVEEPSDEDFDEFEIENLPRKMPYPFRTKTLCKNTIVPKDKRIPPLKKFYRPYFSPKFDSWEVDFFSSGVFHDENSGERLFRNYLAFMNINTKFLKIFPLHKNEAGSAEFATFCLKELRKSYRVNNIRGDDDFAFSGAFLRYLKDNHIRYYFNGSPFINKNRVIDRVIRTIKDAVGLNREFMLSVDTVQQVVYYYNHTPHATYLNRFTPAQAQNDRDLEGWFIRRQTDNLYKIRQKQLPFMQYVRGNVLLIHIPLVKTRLSMKKRRRNFDELALFHDYYHGNARVDLMNADLIKTLGKRLITVPVYYTQFIAHYIQHLPEVLKNYFNQK
jgi:hypothetical protein